MCNLSGENLSNINGKKITVPVMEQGLAGVYHRHAVEVTSEGLDQYLWSKYFNPRHLGEDHFALKGSRRLRNGVKFSTKGMSLFLQKSLSQM